MNLKFMRRVSERERAIRQFVIVKSNLTSITGQTHKKTDVFYHIVCNLYSNLYLVLVGVILVILVAHLVQINLGNLLYTAIFFFFFSVDVISYSFF